MRDSLHPPGERLIAFVEKRLEQAEIEHVRQHLEVCEFCREFSDDYHMLYASLRAAEQEELPPDAQALADRLYQAASVLQPQIMPGLSTRRHRLVARPRAAWQWRI